MNWRFYFTAAICIWPYLAAVMRTDELYDLRMNATETAATSLLISLVFAPLVYLLLVLHLVAYLAGILGGEPEAFWAVMNGSDRL